MGEALEPFISSELEQLGFELVELRRGGSRARPVLEIRMDRLDGHDVNIDDCAKVSRVLEERLEKNALVGERYVLEVSSPGVDRPLRSAADWLRFVGRQAVVTSGLLAGGKQEVEILGLSGEDGAEVALVRVRKHGELELPLREVTQARLAFNWKR